MLANKKNLKNYGIFVLIFECYSFDSMDQNNLLQLWYWQFIEKYDAQIYKSALRDEEVTVY